MVSLIEVLQLVGILLQMAVLIFLGVVLFEKLRREMNSQETTLEPLVATRAKSPVRRPRQKESQKD